EHRQVFGRGAGFTARGADRLPQERPDGHDARAAVLVGNAIDQLVALFQGHAAAWAPTLLGYATALFAGLAVIEFVWVVGFSLARRVELPDLIATVVQQIVTIGFFYWLMHNSPTFLKAIIDSFRMAG